MTGPISLDWELGVQCTYRWIHCLRLENWKSVKSPSPKPNLSWLRIRCALYNVHTEGSIVSVWNIENSSSLRLPNPICLYFPPRHRRPITRLPLLWIENYQFTFIIDVTQICQDDIPIIFPAKISTYNEGSCDRFCLQYSNHNVPSPGCDG